MKKGLIITLFAAFAVLSSSAQQGSGVESFRPKKGDWQVGLTMGRGQFFSNESLTFLIPTVNSGTGGMDPVGPGDTPSTYLKIGDANIMNNNSLVNMAGMHGKYFLTDRIDLNIAAAMDLNVTPSKDYQEGINFNGSESDFGGDVPDGSLDIPAHKAIYGNVTNNWMIDFGSNYYFHTKNERISLYAGAVVGFRMGSIQQVRPYTGVEVGEGNDPIEMYTPSVTGGHMYGLKFGAIAGAEYSLANGLVLGLEVNPVTYYYSALSIAPKLTGRYNASYSNVRAFSCPTLRIGFRF